MTTTTRYAIILLGTLLLAGCGSDVSVNETKKSPYFVETRPLAAFGQDTYVHKSAKTLGAQQITVTALARGRVQSIYAKEGQEVTFGETIVRIADTTDNLGVSLTRAELAEQRAKLTLDQSQENLEKTISDARLALERAENDLTITREKTDQSLRQAEIALENALSDNKGGIATLDLEKARTDLENQITSLKNSFGVNHNSLLVLMDSVVYQGDALLGVTDEFARVNDGFETYLGARDQQQKRDSERMLVELYLLQKELKEIDPTGNSYSNNEMVDVLEDLDGYYKDIETFLDMALMTLENSIESVKFTQTQIDALIAVFRGLQTSYTASYSSYVAYYNSAQTLFSDLVGDSETTLIDQQLDLLEKNVEVQEQNARIAYDQSVTTAKDLLFKAELGVKTAQSTLDNLLATKDAQIGLLENSVRDASNARFQVEDSYDNLFVDSPIQGVIAAILVDEGQEVSPGTPLFTVVNQDELEIAVALSEKEVGYVGVGTDVSVVNNNESYQGTIVSVSNVANQNLQYNAIIELNEPLALVGDVAKIDIPIIADNVLLPLDIVTITKKNIGYIYIKSGTGGANRLFVNFGNIFGDHIELLDNLNGSLEILETSIKNFDKNKFYLDFDGEKTPEKINK